MSIPTFAPFHYGLSVSCIDRFVQLLPAIPLISDISAEESLEIVIDKHLHYTLKSGTSDARLDWFAVGDYKRLPNEVVGMETTPPDRVHAEMKVLLTAYNGKKQKTLEDIIDLH